MIRNFESIFSVFWSSRSVVKKLILREVKSRFAGSALGILWAFLQPLSMMAIMWFVFTYGVKSSPTQGGLSFVAWYFPAQIAWTFFNEGLMGGSNAIVEYAFLVRKIKFHVELLPLVKIGSALVFHGCFLLLLVFVLLLTGVTPNIQWGCFLYFTFATVFLLIGLSWLTSSLTVLFRDVQQLLSIFLQLGFWGTPIVWRADALPEHFRPWLCLNPIYYITEGYRVAFTGHESKAPWSWEIVPGHTLCFWFISVVFFIVGLKVFQKLKPHFGDIL